MLFCMSALEIYIHGPFLYNIKNDVYTQIIKQQEIMYETVSV
jgi:hypothetical protein